MALNKLPQLFLDLNEMSTASRGVAVMYGRRTDGSLVALNVAADGTLESNSTFSGTVTISGSPNSYFADQSVTALLTTYQLFTFGFTSLNITLFNDDTTTLGIVYSFDGLNPHGRIMPGEAFSMDYRAQPHIYLKSTAGAPSYRLSVY